MPEKKFEYGAISTGIYTALLWMTLLVSYVNPNWIPYYIIFVLFLGFGLRPLIEHTGAFELYQSIRAALTAKQLRKRHEEVNKQLDRKMRDDKLRRRRKKDPRLPPRW